MKELLKTHFPIGAESDLFTAALSSAAVIALGYTEATPYWCAPNGDYCRHCSPCGEHPLDNHQGSIYHCLLAASGLAFRFSYPEQRGEGQSDEYVDYCMRFLGLGWQRYSRDTKKEIVFGAVCSAIDAGFPTLLRMGDGWKLVTGYEGNLLFGEAAYGKSYASGDWYGGMQDAIVMTGRGKREVPYRELLARIEAALTHPEHDEVRRKVFAALEQVTEQNMRQTALFFHDMAGNPIEARWHAAEAFSSKKNLLAELCPNPKLAQMLGEVFFARYIADNNNETHGICWKIWGLLGVGPESDYRIPEGAERNLMNPQVREQLKTLFGLVFVNDQMVLSAVREAMTQC